MKARHIACLAALAMPVSSVFASDVSYNYIQAGYQTTGQDNITAATNTTRRAGHGIDLAASVALAPNMFVAADYREYGFNDSSTDFERASLGLGYNATVSRGVDLFAVAKVVYTEYFDGDEDDVVPGASVGFRGQSPIENLELAVRMDWVHEDGHDDGFEDLRSEYTLSYQGIYDVGQGLGIVGEANLNRDFQTWALGVRYSF